MIRSDQGQDSGGSTKPLSDFRWGVERETHRVLPDGSISLSAHPEALSKPGFTRDFAESQLEIVTAPKTSIPKALADLEHLTAEADRALGQELLWPFSMPPRLPEESRIPIARFGTGEWARRAELYRLGLASRYGKARQMICGVHLNVSFGEALLSRMSAESPLTPEEARSGRPSDGYALRLARNLYEQLPLLILLLGASPLMGGVDETEELYAVSYRNSRFGYAGSEYRPYLDLQSFPSYLSGIRKGMRTESPAFKSLGLVQDGRATQLNGMIFQSEKEFYAPIRLRQRLLPGESTLQALSKRGVGYLELRFLDVDPFAGTGVSEETLRLIHLFILDGLARPTQPRGREALGEDLSRATDAALKNPLQLIASAGSDLLLRAADERLADLDSWARRLNEETWDDTYTAVLELFRRRICDPRLLTSAALIRAFEKSGLDWSSFGVQTAVEHRQGAEHELEYARL